MSTNAAHRIAGDRSAGPMQSTVKSQFHRRVRPWQAQNLSTAAGCPACYQPCDNVFLESVRRGIRSILPCYQILSTARDSRDTGDLCAQIAPLTT